MFADFGKDKVIHMKSLVFGKKSTSVIVILTMKTANACI